MIESARKGAIKDSAYGLMSAAEIYIAENMDSLDTIFEIKDGLKVGEEKLSYKDTKELTDKKVVV